MKIQRYYLTKFDREIGLCLVRFGRIEMKYVKLQQRFKFRGTWMIRIFLWWRVYAITIKGGK